MILYKNEKGDTMKIQKHLIAIDLDGTLIKNFDRMDKKSFKLLKKVAKKHYVILATGRPYRSTKKYYDLLKLKTPIVNYNGALVHNPKDKSFPKHLGTINRHHLFKILNDNKNIILNIFSEVEDDIYLWKQDDTIKHYLHQEGGNLQVGEFKNILHEDPNGAIVFSKKGSEEELANYIDENFTDEFKIRFWKSEDFVISEIYCFNTSKAVGLKHIMKHYKIDQKNTIAIGDGHNDIEMLEFVNKGIAMGNSHPELLKRAKFLTHSIDNNGVYKALTKLIKEKQL